ncbi:uncharacterized protein LOC100883416 [Megachile rotundata]|uniref:uncharacterized protein LOC100883416 n=1 Tax=Megachile rotundata TaxID=143995 RepID=UPI0006149CEB|nr:PREDICTED: uncharacterized protein LOC100883416 [Megachile rotundata]
MAKDALLNLASVTNVLRHEVTRFRCSLATSARQPDAKQRPEVNNYARLRERRIFRIGARTVDAYRRDRTGIKEGYTAVSSINRSSTVFQASRISSTNYNMKCIAAVALLALFGVALAKPLETESLEPTSAIAESPVAETENAARDKRGLLVGAAYTAPVAYSAYTAPVAYTNAYSYPYAAYSAYPYYAAAYTAPYYVI